MYSPSQKRNTHNHSFSQRFSLLYPFHYNYTFLIVFTLLLSQPSGDRFRNSKETRWWMLPFAPLMEGLDFEMQDKGSKKESSWEIIKDILRSLHGSNFSNSVYNSISSRKQDFKLLLGVLGCPLAPIPLASLQIHHLHVKDLRCLRGSISALAFFFF